MKKNNIKSIHDSIPNTYIKLWQESIFDNFDTTHKRNVINKNIKYVMGDYYNILHYDGALEIPTSNK